MRAGRRHSAPCRTNSADHSIHPCIPRCTVQSTCGTRQVCMTEDSAAHTRRNNVACSPWPSSQGHNRHRNGHCLARRKAWGSRRHISGCTADPSTHQHRHGTKRTPQCLDYMYSHNSALLLRRHTCSHTARCPMCPSCSMRIALADCREDGPHRHGNRENRSVRTCPPKDQSCSSCTARFVVHRGDGPQYHGTQIDRSFHSVRFPKCLQRNTHIAPSYRRGDDPNCHGNWENRLDWT
mmetsp:Transcript_26609/g.63277  ORF Transcript_26609/g.63277 Transcript_26609/m.63277 type:complete len:237 (+) Transcript_26609:74-784(+)